MDKTSIKRALKISLAAVPLYALVLTLIETRVPLFSYAHHYGAVFPGALLLSLIVERLAGGSPWKGAVWGSLLGTLNAPFSMLCILAWWQFRAELGLLEPWKYGWSGLWGQWCHDFFGMLLVGTPIAIPCGGLLGAWLGQSERRISSQRLGGLSA